ncbi:MAG TPA: hypothetical protein VFM51_09480 [Solirubrobacterales bacterium]|nr:hypothetical protein [Solirubrobacterales bacterium]
MKKLAAVLVLAAGLVAVPALAAEVTRETYKEAVEPICKANTEANEKILAGVRQKVKEGKLDAAARQFFAAARALKRTRTQLLQVPKPEADVARLTKWLRYVKREVELFEAAARKLSNDEKNAAQRMVVRLISNARQTNNLVLEFEFRYCRFQPSKFV